MRKQHCRECGRETMHNPLGRKKASDPQEYRCVECGYPRRTGMAWNRGLRLRGKIVFLGPGQGV